MLIIGITGTLGAGKGTIVDYLVQHKGFIHFSVRQFLIQEIRRRNLPVDRDSMVVVANDLRTSHSPSYIVDVLYQQAYQSGKNCVIESIRSPGEVESLRNKGSFYLFAVDADPELRYHRVYSRNSETDHIDYQTFIENERREMDSTDPNRQNLRRCIEMADFRFENNGTIVELHNQVQQAVEWIEQQGKLTE